MAPLGGAWYIFIRNNESSVKEFERLTTIGRGFTFYQEKSRDMALSISELHQLHSSDVDETHQIDLESYPEGDLCGVCKGYNLRAKFFPTVKSAVKLLSNAHPDSWEMENRYIGIKHLKEHRSKCPFCRLLTKAISTNPVFLQAFKAATDDTKCGFRFWEFVEVSLTSEENNESVQNLDLRRLDIFSVSGVMDQIVSVYVQTSETPLDTRECSLGRVVQSQQVDFQQINKWISACRAFHDPCCNGLLVGDSAKQKGRLTLRVIDVEKACVVEAPQNCEFLALSYCWGPPTNKHLKLTRDTYRWMTIPGALHQHSDEVPTTILDAIFLTQNITDKYLWVDALCIIQDDPVDVAAQILAMNMIYQSAKLTIVAAAGGDAWAGLPGVRPNSRCIRQQQKKCEDFTFITALSGLEDAIRGFYWETRVWTFQEKILSRRLLIFAQGQMFFHCNSASWSEDLRLEPPNKNVKIRRKATFGSSFVKPDLAPENRSFLEGEYRYPVHPYSYLSEPWVLGRKEIRIE
jgi:Heterokaryon incompatibility protein (HET)